MDYQQEWDRFMDIGGNRSMLANKAFNTLEQAFLGGKMHAYSQIFDDKSIFEDSEQNTPSLKSPEQPRLL